MANYQSALLDLMSAQTRSAEAQKKVNTEKNATDLVGFGREAQTVSALKSSQTRIQSFIDTNKAVAARLETQDLALGRVADAAEAARQAIADAIAAGRMDGMMTALESLFMEVQDGLNMKHQGQYLFSGGDIGQAPVQVATLEDLGQLPSTALAFHNGYLKQSSWLDENVSMDTSLLADAVGSDLVDIFRQIEMFNRPGPPPVDPQLTGQMSDAQKTFLTAQMEALDGARRAVVDVQASNGVMQNRVDRLLESQEARKISVDGILAGKTDANMAEAVTELELAQVALQASAQVISQLRQVSLLDYLR